MGWFSDFTSVVGDIVDPIGSAVGALTGSGTGSVLSTAEDFLKNPNVGGLLGSTAGAITGALGAGDAQKQVNQLTSGLNALGKEPIGVGNQLLQNYQKGTINPADKTSIDNYVNNAKARTKQYYNSIGLGSSDALNQQLSQIDQQAAGLTNQALQSYLTSGLNALQVGYGPTEAALKAQFQGNQGVQQQVAGVLGNIFGNTGVLSSLGNILGGSGTGGALAGGGGDLVSGLLGSTGIGGSFVGGAAADPLAALLGSGGIGGTVAQLAPVAALSFGG